MASLRASVVMDNLVCSLLSCPRAQQLGWPPRLRTKGDGSLFPRQMKWPTGCRSLVRLVMCGAWSALRLQAKHWDGT